MKLIFNPPHEIRASDAPGNNKGSDFNTGQL